jgi:hypothetical protein
MSRLSGISRRRNSAGRLAEIEDLGGFSNRFPGLSLYAQLECIQVAAGIQLSCREDDEHMFKWQVYGVDDSRQEFVSVPRTVGALRRTNDGV